jgi:protein-S-isoprenylcysteine O-methyltransferase Ste14
MNYFRGVGMFGSAFLGAHLMRGAAAAALLAWAIVHQTAHPWLSLGAGVAALVALRGCPMCWTVGLVETLSQGRRDSTISAQGVRELPMLLRLSPDFGWSHRLLALNALTGHGCTNLATGREGGTVPKTIAILGSALFFAVAPSTVAGLVPWWITRWEFRPPFFDLDATRAVGILLIVAGLPGLVDSFARFALQGLGTPAPIAPTQNLVVTGLYRYVRNPIYVALVAVILGQAALFGDQRLLAYGVLVWLAFHAFVVGYEEPVLVRTFGTEYEDFRANVPRWIPRLTPWRAARRRNHS